MYSKENILILFKKKILQIIWTRCWSFNVGPISSSLSWTNQKEKKKASLFTEEKYEALELDFLALS